jgi:hypothetical protein
MDLLVIDKFNSLPNKYKPQLNQFTVIAGAVYCDKVIALATGVKVNSIKSTTTPSLPTRSGTMNSTTCTGSNSTDSIGAGTTSATTDSIGAGTTSATTDSIGAGSTNSTGAGGTASFELHDLHAEVLLRRALIQICLTDYISILNGKPEDTILITSLPVDLPHSDSLPVDLKGTFNLHWVISQAPCGDASMEMLDSLQSHQQSYNNQLKRRNYLNSHNPDDIDNTIGKVKRGRLDYSVLGVARTKPGRMDAPMCLSMSCSDKLLKWLNLGLEGSILNSLGIKLNIASITIGDLFHKPALQRAFGGRVNLPVNIPIVKSSLIFPYRKVPNTKPADKCIVWTPRFTEILVNGKLQSGPSLLCPHSLWELYLKINPTTLSHREVKLQNLEYQRALTELKKLSGWTIKPS